MPNTSDAIPLRPFGRHKVKISALGFGGHHLGDAPDEGAAVRLVRQAVDGGVTFFDNCWEYHRGKTEAWMGAAEALEQAKKQGKKYDGDLGREMHGFPSSAELPV